MFLRHKIQIELFVMKLTMDAFQKMGAHVHEYKEYFRQKLPQFDTLWQYAVPHFDETAYPDLDKLSGLELYKKETTEYLKRLQKAAQLRQAHYESFICGKIVEDPGHTAWRLGMNRLVEEGEAILAYWQTYSDELFQEHVERTKPVVVNEYLDTPNVEYVEKAKVKKCKPAKLPRLSQSEIQARRQARIERLQAKDKEEHDLLDKLVKENKGVRRDVIEYELDPNQMFIELHAMLKTEGPSCSIIPCVSQDKNFVSRIKRIPCEEYKKLGHLYAGLCFQKAPVHSNRIIELLEIARKQCFMHHFINAFSFFCYAKELNKDQIYDVMFNNSRVFWCLFDFYCMDELLLMADRALYKTKHDFNKYADIVDEIKKNIHPLWAESCLLARIEEMEEVYKISHHRSKKDVAREWQKVRFSNPSIKSTIVHKCCQKETIPIHNTQLIVKHDDILAKLQKCLGSHF